MSLVNDNGIVREPNAEDIAMEKRIMEELAKLPKPEPSDKERIAALEAAMDENILLLADIIGGAI